MSQWISFTTLSWSIDDHIFTCMHHTDTICLQIIWWTPSQHTDLWSKVFPPHLALALGGVPKQVLQGEFGYEIHYSSLSFHVSHHYAPLQWNCNLYVMISKILSLQFLTSDPIPNCRVFFLVVWDVWGVRWNVCLSHVCFWNCGGLLVYRDLWWVVT